MMRIMWMSPVIMARQHPLHSVTRLDSVLRHAGLCVMISAPSVFDTYILVVNVDNHRHITYGTYPATSSPLKGALTGRTGQARHTSATLVQCLLHSHKLFVWRLLVGIATAQLRKQLCLMAVMAGWCRQRLPGTIMCAQRLAPLPVLPLARRPSLSAG